MNIRIFLVTTTEKPKVFFVKYPSLWHDKSCELFPAWNTCVREFPEKPKMIINISTYAKHRDLNLTFVIIEESSETDIFIVNHIRNW